MRNLLSSSVARQQFSGFARNDKGKHAKRQIKGKRIDNVRGTETTKYR